MSFDTVCLLTGSVHSFPETSLGVPDFSEIIGKPAPLEAPSRNLEACICFPLGFSDFFGLPSTLDLSNEPEISKNLSTCWQLFKRRLALAFALLVRVL